MRYSLLISLLLTVCMSCSIHQSALITSKEKLVFKGVFEMPYKNQFEGTTVGGLSGIDYDSENDVYYLISDDRSDLHPARFYTATIHLSEAGIDTVCLTNVYQLRGMDNRLFRIEHIRLIQHPILN